MGIDDRIEKLKLEITERNAKEMARIAYIIDNHLDSNGKYILDEFPYLIELAPPLINEKYDGFLEWLDENIKEVEFTREWVTRVYFKNEEDAVAFKLRWL